ncbi:MAG: amidohydrolase [Bacillota bacterium]
MILFQNARCVIEDADTVIEYADLLIDGERIAAVGRGLYAPDAKVVDASGKILAPGMVNMHTHMYQNMLKGVRDDLRLVEWCNEVTFPLVGVVMQNRPEEDHSLPYHYGVLGAIEQLRCGVTAFVDMDMIYDPLLSAWREVGVRGVAAVQCANRWIPEHLMTSDEVQVKKIGRLIDKWHNNGILQTAIAPSTAFCCTPEYLSLLGKLARERDQKIYIHVSETQWEVEEALRDYGRTPLDYLESLGFLSDSVCAVHCVHLTESEKQIALERGVTVCYNPKSNMKLGSGIAPIAEYLGMGIKVVLATDGAASNDLLDLFEEMRVGAMLQKVKYLDPGILCAKDVFRMATESGARALGLDAGVLKPGKLADIISIDARGAHFAPLNDPVQQVVYCAKDKDVTDVVVNGRIVMLDGRIVTVDEPSVLKNAVEIGEKHLRQAFPKA